MIMLSVVYGQNQLPVTSEVTIEVLSPSLTISKQPQNMTIRIGANSIGSLEFIAIQLDSTQAVWTVLSARVDGQELWLVQSDARPDKDNLMGWQYNSEMQMLQIYPGQWPAGFQLELEVQLNLINTRAAGERTSDRVIAMASTGTILSRCSESGQGGLISLNK